MLPAIFYILLFILVLIDIRYTFGFRKKKKSKKWGTAFIGFAVAEVLVLLYGFMVCRVNPFIIYVIFAALVIYFFFMRKRKKQKHGWCLFLGK